MEIQSASLRDLGALRRLEQACFGKDAWPLLDLIAVLSWPEVIKLKAVEDGEMIGFAASANTFAAMLVLLAVIEIPFQTCRPGFGRERSRQHESSVFSTQAYRKAAMKIQEIDDFHVDLAGQHHFDDFHRGFICDSHPVAKFGFDTHAMEHLIDLGATAMHNDRVKTHIFQKYDILGEPLFQRRIGHGMTAIFDDNGLALERRSKL